MNQIPTLNNLWGAELPLKINKITGHFFLASIDLFLFYFLETNILNFKGFVSLWYLHQYLFIHFFFFAQGRKSFLLVLLEFLALLTIYSSYIIQLFLQKTSWQVQEFLTNKLRWWLLKKIWCQGLTGLKHLKAKQKVINVFFFSVKEKK